MKEHRFIMHVEAKDKSDWSPLHYACRHGRLTIVKYLISKGANIEAKNQIGQTPLHCAARGRTDVVKYLVSKGANKNAKNGFGKTPYDIAGNDEIRNILKS